MVINKHNPTSLPVLYLKAGICNTCPQKNKCTDENRLMHLVIMAITDIDNQNLLYGGYVCSMSKYQNVPADRGEFLGEKYFSDEDLTKIFDLKKWEEI